MKRTQALAVFSEEAVRRWCDLFRTQIPENPLILEHIVQLDEAYGTRWSLLMGKQKGTRKVAFEMLSGHSVQRHHACTLP
ncbi:MAG: hypothetical protein U1A26_03255 [Candidatus Sungbacteria bacterium]|nr:hypothetical protein [Candidatus Sungbacteria bacterium]